VRFASVFCIGVGLLMAGQWSFFLATGNVPELRTEPVEIGLHLAAELVTAVLLVAGGVGVWREAGWGRSLVLFALGMVAYTEVQSPGYFAARGVWPIVAMFAVLLVGTVVAALKVAGAPKP